MPKDIPPDAKAALDAFNVEESTRATNRAEKVDSQSKKQRKMIERLQSGTVFSSDELASYATRTGWKEIRGGGHRKFENEDGRVITIPSSGGKQTTIERDTAHRILEQIFPEIFEE